MVADLTNLDSADACRQEIMSHIRELESEPDLTENPVSQAVELNALEQESSAQHKRDADILRRLNRLSVQLEMMLLDQAVAAFERSGHGARTIGATEVDTGQG